LWESTPSSLEKAEKDFEKARASGIDSPSLEIDLAASYFERDSRAENPNLQRTLKLLSEVLSKPKLSNDDRASALYNLAIAYEKTQAWDLAVPTWEKYLEVDSASGWANQARQHLKDGKEKMGDKKQHSYSDPSFFLQQKAQGNLRPEDPEQYQQKALSHWLSAAVTDKGSDAYRAVSGLAEVFAEHQDYWWRDFLGGIRPDAVAALRALSNAVQANDEGHYDVAEKQSKQAANLFARLRNRPGELRASFEEVYARRRILNGADCIARADPLAKQLSATNYTWLRARVSLERAECRNIYGEFAESDENLASSRQMANEFHFPVLMLQNAGISAGMKRLRGNCDESWKEAVDGLGLYWQVVQTRSERLFQFYAVMLQCSLETGALDTAEGFIRHTIAMREDPSANIQSDATIDGLLHLHLANILLARRDQGSAAKERTLALALLDQSGEPSAKKYRLVSEIEPAEFQLQQGDPALALSSLDPVIKLLPKSQDTFFSLRCRKLLGDIYLKLGDYGQAVTQYQAAIDLAEASLNGITNGANRLAWLRATDESYRGLVRVLLAQNKEREALEQWEWYQGRPMLQSLRADSLGKPLAPSVPHLKSAPSHATRRQQGIRIVYAGFKDGLQIWISKNDSVQSKWVAIEQQEFEQLAHDFVKKCATESSNLKDIQLQALRLYSLLVQPILSYVSESSVITIELDRRVYNLPIEALRSPEGFYFGEKYAVVYSPGIAIDGALHQPQPMTRQESLLLLDATHSPQSGFLPGMEEERKAILQTFPHTRVIDSAAARWESVQRSLSRSEVFHYMGHGLPNGTGTGLLFNEGHSLRAQDFTPALFKRTQLVVLAACSSAKGKDGLLDTDNLVLALLGAGVPRVIASQWNVDSESTSQLMRSFYRNLGEDKSVAQAMLYARAEMVKKSPHPYYWASFSVAGLAN
jgi:CHAT domain-containing protein/predicted negative regulator of RcsB-dependent stress response